MSNCVQPNNWLLTTIQKLILMEQIRLFSLNYRFRRKDERNFRRSIVNFSKSMVFKLLHWIVHILADTMLCSREDAMKQFYQTKSWTARAHTHKQKQKWVSECVCNLANIWSKRKSLIFNFHTYCLMFAFATVTQSCQAKLCTVVVWCQCRCDCSKRARTYTFGGARILV